MFAAGDRIHQLAVLIEDFDLEVTEYVPLLLVIIDERVGWPAGSVETLVALRPSSVGIEPLNGWRPLDQGSVFCHQIGRQSAQWRNIVNDPNSASVSREHLIGLTRLHHKITHRYRGKVASLVLSPMLPAIDRDPKAEFGSQKQQVRIDGIFLDDVCIAEGAVFLYVQRSPGLSVVRGLVRVGVHVAKSMAVKGGVRRSFIEAAGLNGGHP